MLVHEKIFKMKKDIVFPAVAGVTLAIARQPDEAGFRWHVYLLNRNEVPLRNVIVASKGYGFQGEEQQRTSTLRHLIEWVEPKGVAVVEAIDPAVFHLTNEYWVSYYIDEQIYDKKFLFVPGAIADDHLIPIAQLDLEGVLHP